MTSASSDPTSDVVALKKTTGSLGISILLSAAWSRKLSSMQIILLGRQIGGPKRLSGVKQLHAEHVPIELHGGFHVPNPNRHRRNLFDRWRHEPAVYRPTRTRFSPQHRTGSRRGPEARAAPTAGENNSGIDLIWRCGIIFAVVVFWQDLYRRPAPGANFMSIGSRRLPRSLNRQQERVP